MSFAELFNSLYFAAISLLAWLVPLSLRRRFLTCAIGAFGLAACLFIAFSHVFLTEQASHQLRTWTPVLLILLAYHQSGRLFNKPWRRFEAFLLKLDRKFLGRLCRDPGTTRIHPLLSGYLEISYLACYILVPAALAVLVLMTSQEEIETFWVVVLPSTYLCYALIPLFPASPPRLLNTAQTTPIRPTGARALNLWLLRYASIQTNTFPSAHVAACTAASLVVFQHSIWIGIGFLWIAFSIAAAVVIRRYHYLADAVLGILISVVFFAFLTS